MAFRSVWRVLVRRLSTPATTAAFLMSGASGVLMYFHLDQGVLHRMHQLTGLAMVLMVTLHIVKNFKSLVAYLARREAWAAAAVVSIVSGGIAARALYWKVSSPPAASKVRARDVLEYVANAPLGTVAILIRTDVSGLHARLTKQGFTVTASTASLGDVARTAGRPPGEAIVAAMTPVDP